MRNKEGGGDRVTTSHSITDTVILPQPFWKISSILSCIKILIFSLSCGTGNYGNQNLKNKFNKFNTLDKLNISVRWVTIDKDLSGGKIVMLTGLWKRLRKYIAPSLHLANRKNYTCTGAKLKFCGTCKRAQQTTIYDCIFRT